MDRLLDAAPGRCPLIAGSAVLLEYALHKCLAKDREIAGRVGRALYWGNRPSRAPVPCLVYRRHHTRHTGGGDADGATDEVSFYVDSVGRDPAACRELADAVDAALSAWTRTGTEKPVITRCRKTDDYDLGVEIEPGRDLGLHTIRQDFLVFYT